jgi:hypothetical protein
MKGLYDSASLVERQNILNNAYALEKIREHLNIGGTPWEGDLVFTKAQVAEILDVEERTIDRYLNSHHEELVRNGYHVMRGRALQAFRSEHVSEVSETGKFVDDMNVARKTRALGIFQFRTILNLAMLLTESEKAKAIRAKILDIVMDVIAQRAGGHTKYINQRDGDYLISDFQQKTYRKRFVAALENFVEPFQFKTATYTYKIYKAIFGENAKEYREVLSLQERENPRDTIYAEVLDLIASFESGLYYEIECAFQKAGRKLSSKELKEVFDSFSNHPSHQPLINKARQKMVSRDYCFRDALHENLKNHIQSVPESDFEQFLSEKRKDLAERIEETKDVFKRLRDR